MRKLTLEIEKLQVETFDIDGGTEPAEGTVLARQQGTRGTVNDYNPCNQHTNWLLDANCADSVVGYYPDHEGNCTNVCGTGPLICDTSTCESGPLLCDTSVEVCG